MSDKKPPFPQMGVRLTLEHIAATAKRGARHEAIGAWARETLAKAGVAPGSRFVPQVLSNKMNELCTFVPGPTREALNEAHVTLREPHGVDADDLAVLLGAAILSVQPETKVAIVGRAYDGRGISHVCVAVREGDTWQPVGMGDAPTPTEEIHVPINEEEEKEQHDTLPYVKGAW